MKVGIVCPYAWDVPGGVSAHINDLAQALMKKGHQVSVLAPAESEDGLPDYVTSAGEPRAIKYNGSVARLSFGPVTARKVSKWIEEGQFDILHVHEPLAPSLSVLAVWAAKGPIVGTWHASMDKSRIFLSLAKLAQTAMEKINARIAVSEAARTTLVSHVGGDAVIIPNGVDTSAFIDAHPLSGWPGTGRALVFLGRVDEPRKGLEILLKAFPLVREEFPELRLLIAGPGDPEELIDEVPLLHRNAIIHIGKISNDEKPDVFASGTIYVAPNTGGESFGIVLLEAMASGVPVVASNLHAFERVLEYGKSGVTFKNEDFQDLARVLIELLQDEDKLAHLKRAGLARSAQFDWNIVADKVLAVYESVYLPGIKVEPDFAGQMLGRLSRLRITPERMDLNER